MGISLQSGLANGRRVDAASGLAGRDNPVLPYRNLVQPTRYSGRTPQLRSRRISPSGELRRTLHPGGLQAGPGRGPMGRGRGLALSLPGGHEAGVDYAVVLGPITLRDKLARLVGVSAAVESLRQLPNEWLSL
jgi:hypothetical protein